MRKKLTPMEVKYNLDELERNIKYQDNNKELYSEFDKIGRALAIEKEGYNLYLVDSFSNEKVDKLKKYVEEQYKYLEPPKDICYVILEDIKKPLILFVKNGYGEKLKEAVEEIKNNYMERVEDFYNKLIDEEKEDLIDGIQNKKNKYINDLMENAKKEEFELKVTNKGFAFIPLIEGKIITEKDYESLSDSKKDLIVKRANNLKKKAECVLGILKNIEDKSIKKLKEIYSEFLYNEMEVYKDEVLLKFIDDDNAYEYLEKLFITIERELISCYTIDIEGEEEDLYQLITKYEIHLLVDNSLNLRPPVIYEEDPILTNLIGNIEYENRNGVYSTDISMIIAGSLLKANEGCLILRINSLANNFNSYYHLKKALQLKKINHEMYRAHSDIISINGLKPESIPIKTKIILIGDKNTYDLLYNLDEDFKILFPLKAEVDSIVEYKENTKKDLEKIIDKRIRKNLLMPISEKGKNEVIKYLSRISGNKYSISMDIEEIDRILLLANDNGKRRKSVLITEEDIIKIAYSREKIEEEYDDLYKENKILITINGEKVGVINALAVIDTGYYSFGKPMRITCVAHKGTGQIIDIQKESKLSGKIHEKSINILKGLLNNILNPYEILPIDFYLSFEQTYGLIDGDSASVAEVICILSALSKRPIKQNIAITGSINQLGEVQAIGGVNEKVEGFFRVSSFLDKVKGKAVLIPSSNKDDLILTPEVEEAIEKGEFSIYVMDTLEDAISTMILEDEETIDDFFKGIKEEISKYKSKDVNK
ncbi:AAA family ATPase [Clostridium sp.]|uniref:AAA family ATPase n=1 Tax=Clostridium sp. TaxID=1506 RepID=UPI002623AA0A|nr:AAA family ATPase [Clostridium sp.]